MDFSQYQQKATETAIYPGDKAIEYLSLGLVSEAGEVAGKVKKVIRDNNGALSFETKLQLVDELGDVLWYLSMLATEIDASLEGVARRNITKLNSRKDRDKLGGSGDDR